METAVGIALGALASWVITHMYYRRANREQEIVFQRLPDAVRAAVLDSTAEKLTVPELVRLLEQRTIDSYDPGPLPYKACPRCGSADLERKSATDPARDDVYYFIECKGCGWGEASQ